MSSLKKILANRSNGAQSRGPVTPEGRRRSSENSLTHGLTARTVVLSNEDAGAFDQLLQEYMETFRPVGRFETDLVEQIASSKWREHRACSLETALLDLEMDTQEAELKRHFDTIDETTRAAVAFRALADDSRSLALLNRYESRCTRLQLRAIDQLLALQEKRNLRNEPTSAPETDPAEECKSCPTSHLPGSSPNPTPETDTTPQPQSRPSEPSPGSNPDPGPGNGHHPGTVAPMRISLTSDADPSVPLFRPQRSPRLCGGRLHRIHSPGPARVQWSGTEFEDCCRPAAVTTQRPAAICPVRRAGIVRRGGDHRKELASATTYRFCSPPARAGRDAIFSLPTR